MKYLIMERASEYNDEIYIRQEGGTPVKVFKTQEAADKECLEENIAAWKKGGRYDGIFAYGYDVREATGHDKDFFLKHFPNFNFPQDEDEDWYDWQFPTNLKQADWEKFYRLVPGAHHFEVVEVEEG